MLSGIFLEALHKRRENYILRLFFIIEWGTSFSLFISEIVHLLYFMASLLINIDRTGLKPYEGRKKIFQTFRKVLTRIEIVISNQSPHIKH